MERGEAKCLRQDNLYLLHAAETTLLGTRSMRMDSPMTKGLLAPLFTINYIEDEADKSLRCSSNHSDVQSAVAFETRFNQTAYSISHRRD